MRRFLSLSIVHDLFNPYRCRKLKATSIFFNFQWLKSNEQSMSVSWPSSCVPPSELIQKLCPVGTTNRSAGSSSSSRPVQLKIRGGRVWLVMISKRVSTTAVYLCIKDGGMTAYLGISISIQFLNHSPRWLRQGKDGCLEISAFISVKFSRNFLISAQQGSQFEYLDEENSWLNLASLSEARMNPHPHWKIF